MQKFKVVTQEMVCNTVAEHWFKTYSRDGVLRIGTRHQKVFSELKALESYGRSTPANIARVIGNDSWTVLRCDVCDKLVAKVVQVPGGAHTEYGMTNMCQNCLLDAITAIRTK